MAGTSAPDGRAAAPKRGGRSRVILDWLPGYRLSWLRYDAIAGVIGAFILIPEAIAYARLAGLQAEDGLAMLILPVFAYAIFGSSRQLAVSPSASVSLLAAVALAPLAGTPERYATYAAALAVLVGALLLLAWILRLGFVTSLISRPVALGYAAGFGITLAVTRLAPLLGLGEARERFVPALEALSRQVEEARLVPVLFGLACLTFLLVARRILRRTSGALLLVILASIAVALFGLEAYGVGTVGTLHSEAPSLEIPEIGLSGVSRIAVGAIAIVLLVTVESSALARIYASRHDYRTDANRELLALGASQVAAGLAGGFPLGGSASDTALFERIGARTPLVGLFTALVVLLVVLFTPTFHQVPSAAFEAILVLAAVDLVGLGPLRSLWRFSRQEFAFAAVSALGVLFMGPVRGVFLATAVTVLALLLRAARPRVAELGRLPSGRWAGLDASPEAEPHRGALVVRVYSSLIFANAAYVTDEIMRRCQGADPRPSLLVIDLSACTLVDATAVERLAFLCAHLERLGIRVEAADASSGVRELLRRAGLAGTLGVGKTGRPIDEVLAEASRRDGGGEPGPVPGPLEPPAPREPPPAP